MHHLDIEMSLSLKITLLKCRKAEDCMFLVLHANCHVSVIYMKVMTVDLMAAHMGIHVAQSAIIGHAVCSHYRFRGATSPVLCRLSQCRIRLPGVCQRLCHLPQGCANWGKPRFAGKRYSANRQRIRIARDCRRLPAT